MAPLPMPLNDLEGHICCLKPLWLPYLVTHGRNLWHGASRGPFAVAELLVSFQYNVFGYYLNISAVDIVRSRAQRMCIYKLQERVGWSHLLNKRRDIVSDVRSWRSSSKHQHGPALEIVRLSVIVGMQLETMKPFNVYSVRHERFKVMTTHKNKHCFCTNSLYIFCSQALLNFKMINFNRSRPAWLPVY